MKLLNKINFKNDKSKNSGFSLVEVVVALGILVGVITVSVSTWSGNYKKKTKVLLIHDVTYLLEKKMLETQARLTWQGVATFKGQDKEVGDFGEDFPDYTWTLDLQEIQIPDFRALLTAGEEGADEVTLAIMESVSEYFKSAVTEIKLTVSYKPKNREKPIKYSLATYHVDYGKQLSLPNLGGL